MLSAQPVEHMARRLGPTGLHVRESPLQRFDRLNAVEPLLTRSQDVASTSVTPTAHFGGYAARWGR